MADTWLPIAIAVLGAGVLAYLLVMARRKTLAGEMDVPLNVERGRARSEAEMAAAETDVLSESDSGEVARLASFIEEIRTDEHPIVHRVRRRVVRRDIGRRVAARQRLDSHRRAFESDPLGVDLPAALLPAVMAPSSLPTWELESFTSEWTREQVAALVAEHKAGAAK
ncbi:hypothetical protein Drose_04480 [Dactylosporangium roseum]|uniref:Secreted protein n=1 Tax=Dactylosporangium roseum TaxID=47989 RepID=A0ABY5Z7I3_9ACTN|nr:hypothetical protein [Dactylosporangium roseum]UWZ37546.1 hypothetical protein Drose_04480 [Dactylosporangium roseum]